MQVTNPVQLISIVQQPSGSVNTAVALPVQPRLLITSVGPSIVGQQVTASADPSCTPGATLVYGTCTVLPDSTCEFYNLAVVGIFKEVATQCAPCLFAVAFFLCLFAVTFFFLFVCGDVLLACSTGRTPSLLPLFHLRHHVSSFAAGLCEGSKRLQFARYLISFCRSQILMCPKSPKYATGKESHGLWCSYSFRLAP